MFEEALLSRDIYQCKLTQNILDSKSVLGLETGICSALKYGMNFFWVGFYLVKENQLVLGPFQGPIACLSAAATLARLAVTSRSPVTSPSICGNKD